MDQPARQLAFLALRAVRRGAFADVALEKILATANLSAPDRGLVTELVYGVVRRQRTLDAIIDQLAHKPARAQPADIRTLLHLGLYQLRYLGHIPVSAAVNTTVELAKQNRLAGLKHFVNGLLRQYVRLAEAGDPLQVPPDPVRRLGVLYSFPDWIVRLWLEQLGAAATEALCQYFNQVPAIDLRVNCLRTTREQVAAQFQAAGIGVQVVPHLPQALRLLQPSGAIQHLPGYEAGLWSVQDSSAQLVSYLLEPQPGTVVVDACAAPGGKTTHLAELMHNQGTIWACDRTASRLYRLRENLARLGLRGVNILEADSRQLPSELHQVDAILLDAPCSGLGTLHRHADARWRQTPERVSELAQLQAQLLSACAARVKPGGRLVYATCTLHPAENEAVVTDFLDTHPQWQIDPPWNHPILAPFVQPPGWIKVLPQEWQMDGFFMVRLRHQD